MPLLYQQCGCCCRAHRQCPRIAPTLSQRISPETWRRVCIVGVACMATCRGNLGSMPREGGRLVAGRRSPRRGVVPTTSRCTRVSSWLNPCRVPALRIPCIWPRHVKKLESKKISSCFVARLGNIAYFCAKNLMVWHKAISFEVLFMDEVRSFLRELPKATAKKITYNVRRVAGGEKDNDLFKKLDDDIWEFRTKYDGMEYRLLAFWDETEKRLVVAIHGFIKKTWKVPAKEIARASQLRKRYYELKKL